MRVVVFALGIAAAAGMAFAQNGHGGHHGGGAAPSDTRVLVSIPEPMRSHMLANMREHLLVLSDIQAALGSGKPAEAGRLAERGLGLSSLEAHGASHIAPFMPEGMREAGSNMHRAASRFARVAADADVTGDLKPAIAALADVTRACSGCHAGFKAH